MQFYNSILLFFSPPLQPDHGLARGFGDLHDSAVIICAAELDLQRVLGAAAGGWPLGAVVFEVERLAHVTLPRVGFTDHTASVNR